MDKMCQQLNAFTAQDLSETFSQKFQIIIVKQSKRRKYERLRWTKNDWIDTEEEIGDYRLWPTEANRGMQTIHRLQYSLYINTRKYGASKRVLMRTTASLIRDSRDDEDDWSRFYLDAIEMQVECLDRYDGWRLWESDALGKSGDTDVNGYLEVIFLLTDKGIVGRREIEALVRVHAIVKSGATSITNRYIFCPEAAASGGDQQQTVELASGPESISTHPQPSSGGYQVLTSKKGSSGQFLCPSLWCAPGANAPPAAGAPVCRMKCLHFEEIIIGKLR